VTTYHYHLETKEPELYRVFIWLDQEWEGLFIPKFGSATNAVNDWDDADDTTFIREWSRQIGQYLDRAIVYGLDDPRGRQAVLKACATAIAMAGCTVRTRGDLPRGGTTSGVIK
jgi:hypothetical protein